MQGCRQPLARTELPVDTVSLARFLIGKILVRETAEGVVSGRIVESEAYVVGHAAGTPTAERRPEINRSFSSARVAEAVRAPGAVTVCTGSGGMGKRAVLTLCFEVASDLKCYAGDVLAESSVAGL